MCVVLGRVGLGLAVVLGCGLVELGVELSEGVGLVGESGMGVNVGGYGDVGVAEEFFDGDQWYSGFDQKGRAGVPEIMGAP
jgi:hypothetical protein